MKRKSKIVAFYLLTVLMALGIIVFSSDYIEYRKNYREFQEFLIQKNQGVINEKEINNEDEDNLEQQPTANIQVSQNIQNNNDMDAILSNAHIIEDASGNVCWEPNTISQSSIDKIRMYVSERESVYAWDDAYEKTKRINELDQLILTEANVTFPNVEINFIGDSITEGVGGNVDADGNTISYVNYVQNILHFKRVINNGYGGRMFADYTGDANYSIIMADKRLLDRKCEVTVYYAGLNDYLTPLEKKDFGTLDSWSTAGYCGELLPYMNSLGEEFPHMDFFFVTAYPCSEEDLSTEVVGFSGEKPLLNDYLEQQRILAARNGYHVIELYNIGFMDANNSMIKANYMSDNVHPNDEGYQILGNHIATEIVLYYLGIE